MIKQRAAAIFATVSLVVAATADVFPGKTWQTRRPAEVGLDEEMLHAFSDFTGGRGCVVRHGYLVHTWGDHKKRGDVASAAKPIYAHLLFKAIELEKVKSLDAQVSSREPGLNALNANLGNKDRSITWRHLANQVSCYGVSENPGTAFDYSDPQMALFWDLLFLNAYGAGYDTVDNDVLGPLLAAPLDCEDKPTLMAFGTRDRPGRVAISPRDFCRFGLLYLNQGNWNGKKLLGEEHALLAVGSALPNSIPRTQGKSAEMLPNQRSIGGGNNQTDHMGSYSFLWWTNGVDRESKRHWPAAPQDTYGAFGHGGPRAMVVIPSLDIIVGWNDARVKGREVENEALKRLVEAAAKPEQPSSPTPDGQDAAGNQARLPGQIMIDPDHPRFLKRHGEKHVFICGPGDPEGFLYRGRRNPDGTRDGDQRKIIERLAKHGGNCLYIQMVRSHGGDGEPDHNPFVDSDASLALDEDILDQWEQWFALMEQHDILIYLFFYDDGAKPWPGPAGHPEVTPAAERHFVDAIVKRFKHHPNLIWLYAEESEEAYSNERVRAAADIIAAADDHNHIIGNHHHSGTAFKAWAPGSSLTHYAMQFNTDLDASRKGAIDAAAKADGRYQVIYAENTRMKNNMDFAWAAAMGGAMPMIFEIDIEDTGQLRRCRDMQKFFEATAFYEMSPADHLAAGSTKWVLTNPGSSYILYSSAPGPVGLKQLPAGKWALQWIDCESGRVADQIVSAKEQTKTVTWERPRGFSNRVAVSARRADQ